MTQVPQLRTAVSPLLLEILEGSARCYLKMVSTTGDRLCPPKWSKALIPDILYFFISLHASEKCKRRDENSKRIQPLIDDGLVDEVIRQLMSGKEATVYIVRCGSEIRCAKIYKDADKRSFKQAVQYREGRKVRNSRRARAMEKGSRFGRKQQEETWQNAEVDALYRLADAGVRVPKPYGCFDGVLLMELITDDEGTWHRV